MTGDVLTTQDPAQVSVSAEPAAPKATKELATNKMPASIDLEADANDGPGVLATAHPKPEKRKNARERAQEKFKTARNSDKEDTKDGTTPMTAKAKSKVQDKAKDRAADKAEKAKVKAQKADTKARKISAAKAAKAGRAA